MQKNGNFPIKVFFRLVKTIRFIYSMLLPGKLDALIKDTIIWFVYFDVLSYDILNEVHKYLIFI
jgi:hypothetical protein